MSQPTHILVGEDSEADFLLLESAFAKAGLTHELHRVSDGEKALAYLAGQAPFENRERWPFPDLLILDIKMPKADGFDVLMNLQGKPEIRLPVIMLSGSDLAEDKEKAFRLGAAQYFSKSPDFDGLVSLAHRIDLWWRGHR